MKAQAAPRQIFWRRGYMGLRAFAEIAAEHKRDSENKNKLAFNSLDAFALDKQVFFLLGRINTT